VGNGETVRVGKDPWVGCNECFSLSLGIIDQLEIRRIHHLSQIEQVRQLTICYQAWLTKGDLNLDRQWAEEWQQFTMELLRSNVRLRDRPDMLWWVHAPTWNYSPKYGYNYLMSKKGWEIPKWWVKHIWKLKCLEKAIIFFWCILWNKVPTWDNI